MKSKLASMILLAAVSSALAADSAAPTTQPSQNLNKDTPAASAAAPSDSQAQGNQGSSRRRRRRAETQPSEAQSTGGSSTSTDSGGASAAAFNPNTAAGFDPSAVGQDDGGFGAAGFGDGGFNPGGDAQPTQRRRRRGTDTPKAIEPAKPLPESFAILTQRSIFSREVARGSAAGAQTPEASLAFRGAIAQDDNTYTAYIEDMNTHAVQEVQVGQRVARGTVASITLDSLQYQSQAGNEPVTVAIGCNLMGAPAPAPVPATQPGGPGEGGPPDGAFAGGPPGMGGPQNMTPEQMQAFFNARRGNRTRGGNRGGPGGGFGGPGGGFGGPGGPGGGGRRGGRGGGGGG